MHERVIVTSRDARIFLSDLRTRPVNSGIGTALIVTLHWTTVNTLARSNPNSRLCTRVYPCLTNGEIPDIPVLNLKFARRAYQRVHIPAILARNRAALHRGAGGGGKGETAGNRSAIG